MSFVMRDRSITRHLAMMEVSLGALKKTANTADGTVSDAYLSGATGLCRITSATARGAADRSANRPTILPSRAAENHSLFNTTQRPFPRRELAHLQPRTPGG